MATNRTYTRSAQLSRSKRSSGGTLSKINTILYMMILLTMLGYFSILALRFNRARATTEIKVQDEDLMFRRSQLKNHNKPKLGPSSQDIIRQDLNVDPLPKFSNRQNGPRNSRVIEPNSIVNSTRVVSDTSALAAVDENVTKEMSVHYAIVTTGKRNSLSVMVDTLVAAGSAEYNIVLMVDCQETAMPEPVLSVQRTWPQVRVVTVAKDVGVEHSHQEEILPVTRSCNPEGREPGDNFAWYHGVDFPGGDLRGVLAQSAMACCRACAADAECHSWTFSYAAKTCWMKRPAAMASGALDKGLISGLEGEHAVLRATAKPMSKIHSLARTYYWIMDYFFVRNRGKYRFVAFLEDDFELSPNIDQYFRWTAPLLDRDEKLFCVTAHHEWGFEASVADDTVLLRSDTFPVLAWMTSLQAFERWMWPHMRLENGELGISHWDHWIKVKIYNFISHEPGAETIFPEVPRARHKLIGRSVSTGKWLQQVAMEPLTLVKQKEVSWSSARPSLDELNNYDEYLSQFIRRARATVPTGCLHRLVKWRFSNLVMPLPRALKRNDAEWTRVLLNEMQLDFSFAVYKGTFLTRWMSNRLLLVGRHSPFFDQVQEPVSAAEECSFPVAKSSAAFSLAFAALGKSCDATCAGRGQHGNAFKCDITSLAFVNRCEFAKNTEHWPPFAPMQSASTQLGSQDQQLASRVQESSAKKGHECQSGGFWDFGSKTNFGEGPGYDVDAEQYKVVLPRFASCRRSPKPGVRLLCACVPEHSINPSDAANAFDPEIS